MQSAGEYPFFGITEREQFAGMFLMPASVKCTRRHTGGNSSISVRIICVKDSVKAVFALILEL